MSTPPVVVVTGANAGVGFGICQRLLFQLCVSNPPDSWPQRWARPSDAHGSAEAPSNDGLTLIMACRSTTRAEAARKELYTALDAHIAVLRARPNYDGHADVFRRNLKIEIEYLDLAVLSTVFNFAVQMSKKYSYITHMVFNAGVANFTHIDWATCLGQLASNFLNAITRPEFYVQSVGELSEDGLGWIWQSNLFGHYVLFRALEPLLKNSAYPADSRIIWSSSLEASPKFYDTADWQLTKTEHSYESVKYQIDLLATILDRRALQTSSPPKRIRHFISHPGVCSTKISTNLVTHGGLLDTLKVFAFYLGRTLFGSRHHSITPLNAAIATVHLVLVSLSFITFSTSTATRCPFDLAQKTDRWGNPEVGTTPVQKWAENEGQGQALLEKCDEIFREFAEKRGVPVLES
ncbi:3-keto sterol reductase [Mycena epipterygia]|nr:3-keto sterol reductase [Mycena epipterygia]